MKRIFLLSLGLGLAALVPSSCTSNSSSPPGGSNGDGGSCVAPGVSAACTSCMASSCAAPSASAQTDCAAFIGCYCECSVGDTCCVGTCGASATSACMNDAQNLATCAAVNCGSECAVTTGTRCAADDAGGTDSGGSDAGVDGATTPADGGGTVDAGPCLGTVLPSGYCLTVLATQIYSPWSIAVDPTYVYFTADSAGTVSKIPINGWPDGGRPMLLGSSPTGGALGVGVDSTNVYFATELTGQILYVPLAGLDDGGANVFATALDGEGTGWSLAVNGTSVLWGGAGASAGNGSVNASPLDGGATTALAPGQTQPEGVTYDATYVYWTDETAGTISKAPLAGGGPTTVLARGTNPRGIAVDGSYVYWTDYEGGGLFRAPLSGVPDGGAPTALAGGASYGVVVDANNAYFTTATSVASVPIDGGATTVLVDGLTDGWDIAQDGTNLYFTNRDPSDGGVFQLRK